MNPEDIRALSLDLAVRFYSRVNASPLEVFELADKFVEYIKTGEYRDA